MVYKPSLPENHKWVPPFFESERRGNGDLSVTLRVTPPLERGGKWERFRRRCDKVGGSTFAGASERAIRYIDRMTSRPKCEGFIPATVYVGLAGLEQRTGLEPAKPAWKAGVLPITRTLHRCRSFPAVANHVMVHRRFNVSRSLSDPKHTCSKENLMTSLLGTSPCVRNYSIEA